MKRMICILMAISILSMTTYAGQWQQDSSGWKYQNDDETYKTGWYQDVDGKWYYFDDQTTYMLTDTTTPDGYGVTSDGVWQQESEDKIDNSNYDNVVNVTVSSYEDGPSRIGQFKEQLPVTVCYNDSYNILLDGKIEVTGVEVSKEGIAYVKAYVKADIKSVRGYRAGLKIVCRFILEDGTHVDTEDDGTFVFMEDGSLPITLPLLSDAGRLKKNQTPVSAEVWIDNADN